MARYEEVSVSGYEEFIQAVKQHNGKTIFAYFSGSKDAEGKSWCPDCVQGEAGIRVSCLEDLAGKLRLWPLSRVEKRRESCSRVPQSDLSCLLSFPTLYPTLLLSPFPPRQECSSTIPLR